MTLYKIILFFAFCILFSSCWIRWIFEKTEPCQDDYIENYYLEYYWINQTKAHSYSYLVDSIRGIHVFGKLIIDQSDSIVTRSYEKGGQYPTSFEENGFFFLEYDCIDKDTLILNPRMDTLRLQLKHRIPLIRTTKRIN